MEAKVFLTGKWKNYEDMEDEMSMPELIHTLNTIIEVEYENRKFLAALKGVDLDEGKEDGIEAARKRNAAKLASREHGVDVDENDILATMPNLVSYRQINV